MPSGWGSRRSRRSFGRAADPRSGVGRLSGRRRVGSASDPVVHRACWWALVVHRWRDGRARAVGGHAYDYCMDGDVVVGRVVDPGSAAPVGVSDAVRMRWRGRWRVRRWGWWTGSGRGWRSVDAAGLTRSGAGGPGRRAWSGSRGRRRRLQARATDAVACSRRVVAPRDVARSVGSMVALARRESPALGDRFVGLARALVHEMPHTMAALTAGLCSERVAVAVVAATATLSVEDRGVVDARVGPLLGRLGVKAAGAGGGAGRGGAGRGRWWRGWRRRCKSRRVTVRPAPDGMAYLSVLGPLKDVVGAYAAVQARSRAVVVGSVPGGGAAGSWGGCGRGGHRVGVVVRAGGWSGAAGGGAPGDDRPGPAGHR